MNFPWHYYYPPFEFRPEVRARCETSTVGMPVTRHPPYRPGRAVFPPPVPRLYSRPRCTAEPAGTHAPTVDLSKTGPCYLGAVKDPGTRLPGVTAPLAAPPLAPFVCTVPGPTENAGERAGGPAHAVRVRVAP